MRYLSDKEIYETYDKFAHELSAQAEADKDKDSSTTLIYKAKGVGAGALIDRLIPGYDPDADNGRDTAKEKDEALKRATTLLKATYQLLDKQNETPFVLNMLCETTYYDEADCDGYCLLEDIKACLEEIDMATDGHNLKDLGLEDDDEEE